MHLRFGKVLNIDELISYYPKYEEPLFSIHPRLHYCVKMIYEWIEGLTGSNPNLMSENPNKQLKDMINLCLDKDKILTDELYLTLIKFLRNND